MKVTITKIYRGMVETKFGEKEKIGIKTTDHGDDWLSSFNVQGTENWKEGDTVSISVERKGKYLNFKFPVDPLEERVEILEDFMMGFQKAGIVKDMPPGEEVVEEDSPF